MVQAVVLAGGASRRLGQPKALLPMLGSTTLRVIVERLVTFGIETVVVVHPDLAEATDDLPCPVVINPRPDAGRTGSLHLGLNRLTLPSTEVLVCPVDRPGWDQAVLELLLAAPGEAVVPVHDGRAGHPLLVRGQALLRLAALDADAPLREALDKRTKVEVDAPFLHVNLDRPVDLATLPALEAWLGRGENP